jgi:DNA ligase (NAD+)
LARHPAPIFVFTTNLSIAGDNGVAPGLHSVSNDSPVNMIKALSKLWASASGKQAGSETIFHPTEKCPDCGTRLMRVEESWRCPNLDCPARIRARIEHWCSPGAMDVPGADAAFVALLVGHGLVRDVAELYRLKVREIAALQGMNKDSGQKFFDAITASRKRDGWRVLFGLSIPQVGVDEAKSLCRHFASVDNVFAASTGRLMEADSVGEVAARSIVDWHSDPVNRKLVERLYKAGVNFKSGV